MPPNRPVLQDLWQLLGWTAENTNTCSWASIWPRAWTGSDLLKLGFRRSNLNLRGRANWKWPDWRQLHMTQLAGLSGILLLHEAYSDPHIPSVLNCVAWDFSSAFWDGNPFDWCFAELLPDPFSRSSLVSEIPAYCLQHRCLWVKTGHLPTKRPYVTLSLPSLGLLKQGLRCWQGHPASLFTLSPCFLCPGPCSPAAGWHLLRGSASLAVLSFVASQVALVVKNSPASVGDVRVAGSIPGLRRSLGGGHGNPLQYCCLENPMDRGAWRATVHGTAESRTWLSN